MKTPILIETYKKIFGVINNAYKKRLMLLLVLIAITGVVDLLGLAAFIPVISVIASPELMQENQYLKVLMQFLEIESTTYFTLILFCVALVFFALRSGFIFFSNWVQSTFVFDLNKYLGNQLYAFYLNSNFEEFFQRNSTDILRELTSNTQQFARFIVLNTLTLTTELFVILLIVIGILSYDLQAFILLAITVLPTAYLFNKLLKNKMRRLGDEQNDLTSVLFMQSNRGLFGFIDIKLRRKENTILNEYSDVMDKIKKINVITSVLSIMPAKVLEFVTVFGLFVIFCYGAFWVNNTAVILPLIAIYSLAGYRMIPSLSKAVPGIMLLDQYNFLYQIFDAPLKSGLDEKTIDSSFTKLNFNYEITLKNIDFSYANTSKKVFDKLSLKIYKGETLGLIGSSGSGKTTLVNLICGFLKPTQGRILIDDIELNRSNLRGWTSKISYVQQAPYIETGSLAKNIAFLENTVDDMLIKKVIKAASLKGLIGEENPHNFFINENGKNLSGGQKQRILIARALYNQSQLIILDEATSALDNQTEQEINDTIENLKGTGVSIIIIAHRFSTLKSCNRVLELKNGKIIKESSYQELVNKSNGN